MAETNKKAAKAVTKSTGASTKGANASEAGAATGRGLRKTQDGVVVSSKMDKTIVVSVGRKVRHAAYGKYVRRTKKFYAHDESNQCGVGDKVRIVETRPISKLKRWKVESVLKKAE
jgi:small subunit ribosomal protein S17